MQYISLQFQIEEFDNTHVILCRVNGLMRHHTQTSIDHKEKKNRKENHQQRWLVHKKRQQKKKLLVHFSLRNDFQQRAISVRSSVTHQNQRTEKKFSLVEKIFSLFFPFLNSSSSSYYFLYSNLKTIITRWVCFIRIN